MSRTCRASPPVKLGIDRFGTEILGADVVSGDVVLMSYVGGNGSRKLRSTEGDARAGLSKSVTGKAIPFDRVILGAPGRICGIPEARQRETVATVTVKPVQADDGVLWTALQPIELVIADGIACDRAIAP